MNYFKKIYFALTPKEKFWLLILIILIFISVFLLLIIFIKNSTIVVPKKGGVLKIGLVGQPTNLNPVIQFSEPDKILNRLLFTPLIDLAEKVEPIENNQFWKLRLKENIFWSDNKKITSDDVMFTILKIKEAENSSMLYSFWQNVEVERVSELEVKFKLKEKYSFFPIVLEDFFIVPKHIFADIPVLNWHLSEYNLKPISNGPYKIEKINIEPRGFITDAWLSLNQYYPPEKPFISKINIIFYPNKEELIKSFNSGHIDLLISEEPKDSNLIKIPHNIKIFPMSTYYAIFINQAQNLALKEKGVRQALSLALNKKELISKVFQNYASEISSPIFNANFKDENYNLELANKILDESGWQLNFSGIREKQFQKANIKLNFELIVPEIDFLKNLSELIKKEWEKIGVKINIISIDIKDLVENNIRNRNYQMLLFGNLIYPPYDFYPFWHSAFIFWPGLNLSLYNSQEADKILEKIRTENYSEEDIKNLASLIFYDYPAIFLYSPNSVLIFNNKIYGIKEELISYPNQIFKNISGWYLKTKRVFK